MHFNELFFSCIHTVYNGMRACVYENGFFFKFRFRPVDPIQSREMALVQQVFDCHGNGNKSSRAFAAQWLDMGELEW